MGGESDGDDISATGGGSASAGSPPPPPPPAPTGNTLPPPPPPPAAQPPTAKDSRTAVIVAVAIVGFGVVLTLLRSTARDEDVSYAIGQAVGATVLPGIFFLGFRAWKSTRAGAIAASVVGGLALIAWSGQVAESGRTEQEIIQAMEDLDIDTTPIDLTEAEVDCLDATGLDADDILTALTDTSQVGSATQQELLDAYIQCAPDALLTERGVEEFRTGFNSGLPGEITSEEAECVLREALFASDPAAVLTGQSANELWAALMRCLGPESLALVQGTGGDAQEFGDDPALDLVADRCRLEDRACDLLFVLSPVGSEYWDLAESCGGRGLSGTITCEAGMVDDDGSGFLDDDSPTWDSVVTDCRAGDMISCDLAGLASEIQSDIERVGQTCGERLAIVSDTCVERYGLTVEE